MAALQTVININQAIESSLSDGGRHNKDSEEIKRILAKYMIYLLIEAIATCLICLIPLCMLVLMIFMSEVGLFDLLLMSVYNLPGLTSIITRDRLLLAVQIATSTRLLLESNKLAKSQFMFLFQVANVGYIGGLSVKSEVMRRLQESLEVAKKHSGRQQV